MSTTAAHERDGSRSTSGPAGGPDLDRAGSVAMKLVGGEPQWCRTREPAPGDTPLGDLLERLVVWRSHLQERAAARRRALEEVEGELGEVTRQIADLRALLWGSRLALPAAGASVEPAKDAAPPPRNRPETAPRAAPKPPPNRPLATPTATPVPAPADGAQRSPEITRDHPGSPGGPPANRAITPLSSSGGRAIIPPGAPGMDPVNTRFPPLAPMRGATHGGRVLRVLAAAAAAGCPWLQSVEIAAEVAEDGADRQMHLPLVLSPLLDAGKIIRRPLPPNEKKLHGRSAWQYALAATATARAQAGATTRRETP